MSRLKTHLQECISKRSLVNDKSHEKYLLLEKGNELQIQMQLSSAVISSDIWKSYMFIWHCMTFQVFAYISVLLDNAE